jgi:hypothetical protein
MRRRVVMIDREPNSIPVAEITHLYAAKEYSAADLASMKRTLSVAAPPDSSKEYFRDRVQRFEA